MLKNNVFCLLFCIISTVSINSYAADSFDPNEMNAAKIKYNKARSQKLFDQEWKNEVGSRIRELCSKWDVTLTDLERNLDIKQPFLSAIQNGNKPIPFQAASKIAEYLDAPINWLLAFDLIDSRPPMSIEQLDKLWRSLVGDRIKSAIETAKHGGPQKLSITQYDLANELNLSQAGISKIINGQYGISISRAKIAASYLGTDVNWLVGVDLIQDFLELNPGIDIKGIHGTRHRQLRELIINIDANGSIGNTSTETPCSNILEGYATDELIDEVIRRTGWKISIEKAK